MSKPDPAGGSLESILASIRKSLSEQSTEALSEDAAKPADQENDARPPRKNRLTQRLAGTTPDASPVGRETPRDDLSDLLEEAPAGAPPTSETTSGPVVTTAPNPAPAGEKDPLWFLSRRDDAPAEADLPSPGAPPEPKAGAKGPAATPSLTRPEVLRASMPPFFGSSDEAARSAETAPAGSPQPAPPPRADSTVPAGSADAAMAHEVSLVAAAAEAAAARPAQPPPQNALNGTAGPTVAPQAVATVAGDALNRQLEVMVLDLLKPMLRQWLDENMPRLVAEALEEEVQRTRAARGGVGKA